MTSKSTWTQQDKKIAICRVTWPTPPLLHFFNPWYHEILFSFPGVAFLFKPQVTHKCAARLWNMCVMSWISVLFNSEVLIKTSWKTINPQTLRFVYSLKRSPRRPPENRPKLPHLPTIEFIPKNPHKYSGKWLKEVQPTFALSNEISQQFSVNVLRTCCCEHRSALVMHASNVYTAYIHTYIHTYIYTLHFIYTIYLLHFLTHVYMHINYIYISLVLGLDCFIVPSLHKLRKSKIIVGELFLLVFNRFSKAVFSFKPNSRGYRMPKIKKIWKVWRHSQEIGKKNAFKLGKL